MMLSVGSLFSGIGGFDLGLERAGMRIEWQVENNDWCREVLKKHWPEVPCHYDITQIDWDYIPKVDLVCGGFPCQPFSLAGKRRGQADDRYLWPEVVRCLETVRPTWFIGENVPGFASMAQFTDEPPVDAKGAALGEIGDVYHRMGRGIANEALATLESLGYQVVPFAIPACAVDAPHQRQRVWIVAHAECAGLQGHGAECGLREDQKEMQVGRSSRWPSEPGIQRVAHGVPRRVDRLRGLGNAVVPQVVEAFGQMILECQEASHGA